MKFIKRTTVALAAASLSLTAVQAVSPQIHSILELTEPDLNPAQNGSWLANYSGFTDVNVSSSLEYFSFCGKTDDKLPGDEYGTHWGALLDANGTTISDIL